MIIGLIKNFLERIDYWRDRILSVFIKKYWPRSILPNHLSTLKIFVGVILLFLLIFDFRYKLLVLSLFCFGLGLDLFDGSVARSLNQKTKLGALLDPIGDKILILPLASISLFQEYFWILLFILVPEFIAIFDAIYYKLRANQTIEANIFGKTKMALHSLVFGIILLRWPSPISQFSIVSLLFGVVLAFLSIIFQWLDFQNSLNNSQLKNAQNL